jgi:APA family basic amino acid/polyamine antiporter
MAEETRLAEKRVPRAIVMMIFAVLVIFSGMSLVSFLAMTPQELATAWVRDPVAGIAANIPVQLLADILKPLIAVLAAVILLIAGNAALTGISRLVFSLGERGLAPRAFSQIHPRFQTPYLAIVIFGAISILVLIPAFFFTDVLEDIAAIYAFGSLLAFLLAHASILRLRIREPDNPRPFHIRGNITVLGYQLPVTAILGLITTAGIWIAILVTHPYIRWIGIGWMIAGLIFYIVFLHHTRPE